MEELLEELTKRSSKREAKRYLAKQLGVSYQAVKKWFDQGHLPMDRAVECEYLFGLPRRAMMDKQMLDVVLDPFQE